MAKRGFTLTEMMLVVGLASMVLAAAVSLYAFTMVRLAQGTSRYAVRDQVRKVLDEVEAVVRDSVNVQFISSAQKPGLKCTLAAESKRSSLVIESQASKIVNEATPVGVTKRGIEKHGTGRRVWFYQCGAGGNFGSAGNTLFRAERNDDTSPSGSDTIPNFTTYYGTGAGQLSLITDFTFSLDPTNKTVYVTVTARSLWQAERSGTGTERGSQSFTESRIIGWRNWFQ